MSLKHDPGILSSVASFPAGMPPDGIIASLDNPYTLASQLYVLGSVSVLVMLCFVAARLYAKHSSSRPIHGTIVSFFGVLTDCTSVRKAGVSTHQRDLSRRIILYSRGKEHSHIKAAKSSVRPAGSSDRDDAVAYTGRHIHLI